MASKQPITEEQVARLVVAALEWAGEDDDTREHVVAEASLDNVVEAEDGFKLDARIAREGEYMTRDTLVVVGLNGRRFVLTVQEAR
jgi:hypothetical protein